MKCLIGNDTIQIEITNVCKHNCANCTRFVHHVKQPYFMDLDYFKKAVDSMVGFPKMTGIMGGEPLLHPRFEEMCDYLHSKIPPRQTGLWTCLPPGKEHLREAICKTFGNIFINDHSRDDIYHHPFLVSASEVQGIDEWVKWTMIDGCFFQYSWSASINPHGAFFCEIAAALSMLLDEGEGWPVEPGWWTKTPKDYTAQIERYCMLCGGAMPLQKRVSTSGKDEISPMMFNRVKEFSRKVIKGEYDLSDCQMKRDDSQLAAYKDQDYRDRIGSRYGIYMTQNDLCFLTPHLVKNWKGGGKNEQSNDQ